MIINCGGRKSFLRFKHRHQTCRALWLLSFAEPEETMKLLKSGACQLAPDGGNDKELTVMEDAAVDGLSDNIIRESTEVLYIGSGAESLLENAFHGKVKEQGILLAGVVSRKKQMIPAIVAAGPR